MNKEMFLTAKKQFPLCNHRDGLHLYFPCWAAGISFYLSFNVWPVLEMLFWQNPKAGLLSSVQSLSHVRLFGTSWTAACQVSLSITIFRSLLKVVSVELVMQSNHLTLCNPLLLLPSIFPNIRVFSNESVLIIRWPKYWSFSISPSSEYSGLISFRMDWLDLLAEMAIHAYHNPITILLYLRVWAS